MNSSQYLAAFFQAVGIERVYTLSGGMIAPLMDAIGEQSGLKLVAVSHEQSAAFAAEAEGFLMGKPGVALGTSGPSALNLVTGIASAYYDSVPTIFIGGQVQTYVAQLMPGARQSGLQQCDFAAVCAAIAKEVISPKSAREIPAALHHAYEVAMADRPGPVVLDIPLNVQTGETGVQKVWLPDQPAPKQPVGGAVDELADAMRRAERPIILAGGGARRAAVGCRSFAQRRALPVVTTTAGLDVAAGLGPLGVGMCGMYGTRAANTVLSEADFVLVIGSRLDHAVIGADPAGYARKRQIWQIDVDPVEAGARAKPSRVIISDAGAALALLSCARALDGFVPSDEWTARVSDIVAKFPTTGERSTVQGIDPNCFAARMGRYCGSAGAFVVDAGQHTWFVGQSLGLRSGQLFVTSTGLHACGTAIPAAIATALCLRRTVVAIAGDGAIQLNIQDLATIAREHLPVKTVIINNHAHGSVRQYQVEFVHGRYHGAVWGLADPDFQAVFSAYGIRSRRIASPNEIDDGLDWLWRQPDLAQMLVIVIHTEIQVSPSVPFGRQLSAMVPSAPGAPR
jgi:acetolactate synthase I/II/III large subunit